MTRPGADFEVHEGDYGSVNTLTVSLLNADNSVFTAPDGTTAVFRMVGRQSGVVVTGAATFPTQTSVSYTFVDGDTDTPDYYDVVFVLTLPGGSPVTFPTCSSPGKGFVVEVCPGI